MSATIRYVRREGGAPVVHTVETGGLRTVCGRDVYGIRGWVAAWSPETYAAQPATVRVGFDAAGHRYCATCAARTTKGVHVSAATVRARRLSSALSSPEAGSVAPLLATRREEVSVFVTRDASGEIIGRRTAVRSNVARPAGIAVDGRPARPAGGTGPAHHRSTIVRALLAGLAANGGASVTSYGRPAPQSAGLVVAVDPQHAHTIADAAGQLAHPALVALVGRWVDRVAHVVTGPQLRARVFGAWVDGGNVYLDVSEIFPAEERAAALAAGAARNQIAIYDLASGVDVPTGGTGEPPIPQPLAYAIGDRVRVSTTGPCQGAAGVITHIYADGGRPYLVTFHDGQRWTFDDADISRA